MERTWDVVVVGGGPAGSRAAEVIAREGFSVIVLDKKKVIGEPNHCGEGISAHCLNEIGVETAQPWIVRQVKGARLIFPNRTTIYFTQKGYCIDRPCFDRFLSARARANGAVIKTSAQVKRIIPERSRWIIKAQTPEGPRDFSSRYLIGAGGALCPVAGYLGERPMILPSFQYKFAAKGTPQELDDSYLQFHHHEDFRGGYAWVFHRGKEISVGAGTTTDLRIRLERFCIRLGLDPGKRIKVEGGPIAFLSRPLRITFPKVLLCGDAGGFIYPLTKGGVHGAVWSGRIAGEVIVKALKTSDPYALSDYTDRVSTYPCQDRLHLLIPQAFFKFDNSIINTIGNIMDKKEYSEVPIAGFLRYFLARPLPRILWGIAVGFTVQRFYHRSARFAW
ncbi:NAD(P)/FAD-dependent oxidoreductase [candidate division WOR-3 bacterium]|nr:NAD(P)/FAD-dependent oxidoreductase [candidate division WOR-3 bacterium]